mgnify:CR=1 FL=1
MIEEISCDTRYDHHIDKRIELDDQAVLAVLAAELSLLPQSQASIWWQVATAFQIRILPWVKGREYARSCW